MSGAGPASAPHPPGFWWVWCGLHGGSGVTTLSQAVPGGADIGVGSLPPQPGGGPSDAGAYPGKGWRGVPAVGVCRSHAAGLEAAQWWSAHIAQRGKVVVLGLVVVADAPGRLPRPLESMLRLISGGYPTVWRMPWVNEWRLGQPPTQENTPPVYRHLQRDLFERTGVPFGPDASQMGGT